VVSVQVPVGHQGCALTRHFSSSDVCASAESAGQERGVQVPQGLEPGIGARAPPSGLSADHGPLRDRARTVAALLTGLAIPRHKSVHRHVVTPCSPNNRQPAPGRRARRMAGRHGAATGRRRYWRRPRCRGRHPFARLTGVAPRMISTCAMQWRHRVPGVSSWTWTRRRSSRSLLLFGVSPGRAVANRKYRAIRMSFSGSWQQSLIS
jgi:hypothetical protein